MKATDANRRLQYATNVTDFKSVLVLLNIFGRFVPAVLHIASMWNRNLEKNQRYHFGRMDKTEIEALETAQNRLLSFPRITTKMERMLYVLHRACPKQVVCILLQE